MGGQLVIFDIHMYGIYSQCVRFWHARGGETLNYTVILNKSRSMGLYR